MKTLKCMSTVACKFPEIPSPRMKSMVGGLNKYVCVRGREFVRCQIRDGRMKIYINRRGERETLRCPQTATKFGQLQIAHYNIMYRKGTYSAGTSFLVPPSISEKPMEVYYLEFWMNELYLHCMLLVSYIQQYFNNTSITVLTNQVWKLLIALFKVPNTGAFTLGVNFLKLWKWWTNLCAQTLSLAHTWLA